MVTAHGLGVGYTVNAALLAWGQHLPSRRWAAGIAFIHSVFRGRPINALITVWLPAPQIERHRGQVYLGVPRVVLRGTPEQWPALPAIYPHAGPEWIQSHQHVARPDPAGRYGRRPTRSR